MTLLCACTCEAELRGVYDENDGGNSYLAGVEA
jgi:hypothetical protein